MCENKKTCKFGSLCSKAHDQDELRDPESIEYKRMRELPSLGDFTDSVTETRLAEAIPVPNMTKNPTSSQMSKKHGPLIDCVCITLSSFQQFVMQCNKNVWNACVTECQKSLCRIELISQIDGVKIIISGTNSEDVSTKIKSMLQGPLYKNAVALNESMSIDEVVLKQIQKDLDKKKLRFDHVQIWNPKKGDVINNSDHTSIIWFEIDANREVLNLHEVVGAKGKISRLGYVVQELDSWIEHNKYKSAKCEACLDSYLDKQGVKCPKGHFFCVIEDCFTALLESQKPSFQSQKAELRCPSCASAFKEQDVAKVVTHDTWKDLFKTILDAKVNVKYEELSREFDGRVQAKVDELISQYASSDDQAKLKLEAKIRAKEVRNEALNLSCPQCKTVYAEFDGCMALVCSSCKGISVGFVIKARKAGRLQSFTRMSETAWIITQLMATSMRLNTKLRTHIGDTESRN